MTRRECEQVRQAIQLLWNEDDALGALVILKRLIGLDTAMEQAIQETPGIDVWDLLRDRPSMIDPVDDQ